MTTLWDCERKARDHLARVGSVGDVEGWDKATLLREAAYLIEGVWEIDATARYLMRNKKATPPKVEIFEEALLRRKRCEPLALILRKKWFYGHLFVVNESTLIPRADSETLIDVALLYGDLGKDDSDAGGELKIIDWGTGSGCLLITLLLHFRLATGVGIDKSERALFVAKQNGVSLGVDDRASWVCGDWSLGLDKHLLGDDERVMVVSNPPYIVSDIIECLETAVKNYEPMLALDGGADGLVAIRHVLATTADYGRNTLLLMEIGQNQQQAVRQEAALHGWQCCKRQEDRNEVIRVLVFKRYNGSR